ncbi:MAG: hypothetical protein Q9160_008615 [Pyrenula sp. 1 TL-2023]
MSTLPSTAYTPATRQVRGTPLNTIIEDQRENRFTDSKTVSSDSDEGTIIGRPTAMDPSVFVAASTRSKPAQEYAPSPLSEVSSLSDGERAWSRRPPDFDDMYDVSDEETEFSETCSSTSRMDSASSRPTSFATESSRSSLASSRSSRNRYPSILIPPTTSWPSLNKPHKSSPVPPTPPPKIPVSPAVLSLLPKFVPSINAPPSLDSASVTSASDRHSNMSAPVTPDMHILVEGEPWGEQHIRLRVDQEIIQDVSASQSPIIPEDEVVIEQPENWDALAGSFPDVPGLEPQNNSPTLPPFPEPLMEDLETLDHGVQLPSDALSTLDHLSLDKSPDPLSETSSLGQRDGEMQEISIAPSRPRSAEFTPASDLSGYSFSQLSIPSPGGFFRSLKPGSRHTWAPGQLSNPPSSTTAENFYNVPWQDPRNNVVEQVIQADERNTDGPPTARGAPPDSAPTLENPPHDGQQSPPQRSEARRSFSSSMETIQEISRQPGIYEYEEAYEEELLQNAAANLDRTSIWLSAQATYLSALRETNPKNDLNNDPMRMQHEKTHARGESVDSNLKKVVRFLEDAVKSSDESSTTLVEEASKQSVYYEGFSYVRDHTKRRDSFLQRAPRFDAVQAARVGMVDTHIDQLLGLYEIREPQRPKYTGPFSQNPRATGLDWTPAQLTYMKVEREKAALDQLSPALWVVEAMKFLNGGHLFAGPAAKRLKRAKLPLSDPLCRGSKCVRVLDLGGQGACDWAWHCARKYPRVKTYTAITKQQAANKDLEGPPNHRQITVPHLWQLPFRDGYFDVISARSLHMFLKLDQIIGATEGEDGDEYDYCLRECHRVLKPGGYMEYMLMDAAVAHAGPLAQAMSVEFGFNLKTRGYDPTPTKAWLGRLRKSRFVGIKRAWMFLPMGTPAQEREMLKETPDPVPKNSGEMEAVRGPVGSTADVANITGLLGGWMWEQWMLKLQMDLGREREKLLEGVPAVIEEGRNGGAGWNCLSGWARKPGKRKERS